MGKAKKISIITILVVIINAIIFGVVYLKNNISVSLFIKGNKYTQTTEILKKFQERTDVFYWYLRRWKIIDDIKTLPFVKDVTISPKSLKEFYKITINITEEEPYYLFKQKDKKIKIVSANGKVITYLNTMQVFGNKNLSFEGYPVVFGLDEKLHSAETLNSRLLFMSKLIKKLKEKITKFNIKAISYVESGDVVILFEGLTPTVVMDISKSDDFIDSQIQNFIELQNQKFEVINGFSQIDLAYEKQAVLKP